ncbi:MULTISPECIES: glycosyltransferase [unclassified Plantactinospora]|uniref:glycosyltransferase n=1 Tax=unclassified Plantactinospora TaxID=2631981 RepID=UPI00131ED76B|nr:MULTISPECIES: glycosyltransferase [unclassified Plantactinospora]
MTVRVAHVVGSLDRGGAETVSLDICRAVPADEFAQTFVTLGGTEGSLAHLFRVAGAQVRQCPLRPARLFLPRLWHCLRTLRPDVVVAHVSLSSAVVLGVARVLGVPVRVARMWSEGDGRADRPGRRLRRAGLRLLLRQVSTDVVGVTEAALAFAGPRPGDRRYRVLYNSVDVARLAGADRAAARRRWGIAPETPVLLHLGRAAEAKNRPYLVELLRAARRIRPDSTLLLAGPGGVVDLTSVYPEFPEEPGIVLAGEVDEVTEVLAAADVFVLPSRREGLPGVVLEALALGLPVLASDLACLREVGAQVEGVTLLPLAAGPERWARVALDLAETSATQRHRIRRSLLGSPFVLPRAVAEWTRMWAR